MHAHDRAGHRSVDGDAAKHVFRFLRLLTDAIQFGLQALQFVEGSLPVGVFRLHDLLFEFDYLRAGLGNLGGQPADLTFRVGHRPLDRLDFGLANQSFVQKRLLARVFFLEECQLPPNGIQLLLYPSARNRSPSMFAIKQSYLAVALALRSLEIELLACHDRRDLGIASDCRLRFAGTGSSRCPALPPSTGRRLPRAAPAAETIAVHWRAPQSRRAGQAVDRPGHVSPSLTSSSLMIPPSRCWTILFCPVATKLPCAMTAAASGAVNAHVPKPPKRHRMSNRPTTVCLPDRTRNVGSTIPGRELWRLPLSFFSCPLLELMAKSRRPRCSCRGSQCLQDVLAHAEHSDRAVDEKQYLVDALKQSRPLRDRDDGDLLLLGMLRALAPARRRRQRRDWSWARRARPVADCRKMRGPERSRCFWPPESGAPSAATNVS